MDHNELLTKYHALQSENHRLREEIKRLRLQLGIPEQQGIPFEFFEQKSMPEMIKADYDEVEIPDINNLSTPAEKIKLFMSLFKGRDDVYAKRWENKKKGTSGYSPVCLNEWRPGLCAKPKGKCFDCVHKVYDVLEEKVIDAHLRGLDNLVVGIYPLLPDETCCFLASNPGRNSLNISAMRG